MTYGQLKADIAAWLARGDLSAVIPSLIRLAEDDINDDLRLQDMVRRARTDGADSRYVPLPIQYLEMRKLTFWADSSRPYSLIQVTPENLQVLNLRDTSTSSYNFPQRYAVHREIEFDAPVASVGGVDSTLFPLEMIYYRRYDAFVDDTDTNWVLQNAYACYLYGSLVHAEPYLRHDERIPTWAAGYQKAISTTMMTEMRGRVNQGETRVALSGSTP